MKPIIFGSSVSEASAVVHEQHLAGPDMNDEKAVNAWFCAWLNEQDPIPDATAATFKGVGDQTFNPSDFARKNWIENTRLNMMHERNGPFKPDFDYHKAACENYERLQRQRNGR